MSLADWTVNLDTSTAMHRDGWVFRFRPSTEPGAFDGECIGQPSPLTRRHMAEAARIAREAGDAYIAARADRH